jgi:hypothetical protein
MSRSFWLGLLYGSALAAGGFSGTVLANGQGKSKGGDTLVVSRVQYVAPSPLPAPPNTFRKSSPTPTSAASRATSFSIITALRPARPAEAPWH